MAYPGGKSGAGVYQTIINLMPKHGIYIEPFLGGAAIMEHKQPASVASIGIDADTAVIRRHQGKAYTVIHGDGISYLATLSSHLPPCAPSEVLIYCDPPYLMDTRSSKRPIYQHEMTDDDHRRLLDVITRLSYYVMISGYASEMYDQALKGWRRETFRAITRGGSMATEVVWLNFAEPLELHDYRYLGATFRERERIKRKKQRWQARLQRMDALERAALMQAIEAVQLYSPNPAMLEHKEPFKPGANLVDLFSAAIAENDVEISQL